MGFNLIIAAVILLFVAGGGVLLRCSIAENAVAKHEQEVKVQQDKVEAVAKVKMEETDKKLIDMQAAYDQGRSEREIVEKKVYLQGKAYAVATPAVQNKDCVIPQDGMDMLNKARAAEAVRIFGFTDTIPVTISEPKLPPAIAPVVPPAAGSRPKPVPVK